MTSTSTSAEPTDTPTRNVLVVRGGWEGHSPVEATDRFIPFLREQGFAVRVEDSPEVYTDTELMAGTDLVLQCYTMGTATNAAVAGLRTAVEAGCGLAGWHGGIADSFRASAEYLHLVGGQFACHPSKEPGEIDPDGGPENNYLPYTVNMAPAAQDHPVTSGVQDFELVTEQYWVLSDDYVDVLATTTLQSRAADPWHRPVTAPAVWTRQWGAGRVFVATPGHSVDVLDHPSVRTLVERGLLWAARSPETS